MTNIEILLLLKSLLILNLQSYYLELSEQKKLNTICQRFSERKEINIEIFSYSDSQDNESDKQLVQWRALNVLNFFIRCGFDLKRLHVGGLVNEDINPENAQTAEVKFFRIEEDNP